MIRIVNLVIVAEVARDILRLARNGDVIFAVILVAVIRLVRAIGNDAACVTRIEIVLEVSLVFGRDHEVILGITFVNLDLARVVPRFIEAAVRIVDLEAR